MDLVGVEEHDLRNKVARGETYRGDLPTMSLSHRRTIATIIGIVLLVIGAGGLLHEYAQGRVVACAQANPRPGYSPDDPKPALQSTRHFQTTAHPFQPLYKEMNCEKPYGPKEYEFCQQWRAANAGQEQACIAGFQFWLGSLTTYVSALGLLALIATVIYTALMAGATSQQVALSRQAMTNTERAFVYHDGMRWISHPIDGGRIIWNLRPSWINSGNTPTRGLSIQVAYHLGDAPIPESFAFGYVGDRRPAMIRPNGLIEGMHYIVKGEDLQAVKARTKHLFVWGTATYNDVFEGTPQHVTRFCCYVANVTGDPLQPWHKDDNPVDLVWANYHQHNCADEDCERQRFQPPPAGAGPSPHPPRAWRCWRGC